MREDRRAKQLARLNEARVRTEQRLELQRKRVDARFAQIHRRLVDDRSPSDDQQRFIDAALKLLDEDGLQELSLRKLAAKLDVKAPALYWHFKNKEDLIDYMAEAILKNEFANLQPRGADESWQEWLITVCKRLRKAMLSYRDGARIVAGAHLYPAITQAELLEITTESLLSAGVDELEAETIIITAIHFTFGRVIEEQSSPSPEEIQKFDFAEMFERFPHLAKITQRMHATGNIIGLSDEQFDRSLRLIVR